MNRHENPYAAPQSSGEPNIEPVPAGSRRVWLLTEDEFEKVPDGTRLVQTGYLTDSGKVVVKGQDKIDIEPTKIYQKGILPWSKKSYWLLVGFLDDDSPKPSWFSTKNRQYNFVPAKDVESKS